MRPLIILLIATAPIFISLVVPLAAQSATGSASHPVIEKNNYIIRFSPRIGSYSLYKREVGRNRLVRLINDREPRSTYIAVALNGKAYTLGRNTRYLASKSERLTLLTDGGFISWKLPQRVSVKYYIRVLNESSLTSYIRLNIIIENAATVSHNVGLFHMFDIANNNLGLPAFSLPDGDVFRETILDSSQVPYFVQTSYNAYFYLDVRGASRPDRVILANWTKLHEAGWNYGFQLSGQGFGYNLYDSNNPALGVYYDSRPLPARQSRSYVLYLALDRIPSFSNVRELGEAQIVADSQLRDNSLDSNISTEPNLPKEEILEPVSEIETQKNLLTEELLRDLITEQRRSNDLLEQVKESGLAAVEVESDKNRLEESNNSERDSLGLVDPLYDIPAVTEVDIQALNLLYQSENKRFTQLQSLQEYLEVNQEQQEQKLESISLYSEFSSPAENLQVWRIQQVRMLGQLENWDTYLVHVVAQLPENLQQNPEIIKFHNNLRDLRLAVKELSEYWTPLIHRIENTWEDWQAGRVGEPPVRISELLYRSQKKLAVYMNELSDMARYSSGVQQRMQTGLYGELSHTLLAVREHLVQVDLILQQLYGDFSEQSKQVNELQGVTATLQKSLFLNERELLSSRREVAVIEAQLQVVFSNIGLLEQWQKDIELNQSLLAYDSSRKEQEIKELLQKISMRIDELNQILEGLQDAQSGVQAQLEQIARVLDTGLNMQTLVGLLSLIPLYQEQNFIAKFLWQNVWSEQDMKSYRGRTVQLLNPYPEISGDNSTLRNKMSDIVRPQIDENELYNAFQGFPKSSETPLPNSQQNNNESGSSILIPDASSGQYYNDSYPRVVPQTGPGAPIVPKENVIIPNNSNVISPTFNYAGQPVSPQILDPKDSQNSNVIPPASEVRGNYTGEPVSPKILDPEDSRRGSSSYSVIVEPKPDKQKYDNSTVIHPTSERRGNYTGEPVSPKILEPNNLLNGEAVIAQPTDYGTGTGTAKLEPQSSDLSIPKSKIISPNTESIEGRDNQLRYRGVEAQPALAPNEGLNNSRPLSREGDISSAGDMPYPPGGSNGGLFITESNTLIPGSTIGQKEQVLPPNAGEAIPIDRPEMLEPNLVLPDKKPNRISRPQQPISQDPYRDVKNFIQDVDSRLKKKKWTDESVNGSQKRWLYLQEKYNIPK